MSCCILKVSGSECAAAFMTSFPSLVVFFMERSHILDKKEDILQSFCYVFLFSRIVFHG